MEPLVGVTLWSVGVRFEVYSYAQSTPWMQAAVRPFTATSIVLGVLDGMRRNSADRARTLEVTMV